MSRIKRLAMTTQWLSLAERAQSFYDAGIRAIISASDSLDAAKFKQDHRPPLGSKRFSLDARRRA